MSCKLDERFFPARHYNFSLLAEVFVMRFLQKVTENFHCYFNWGIFWTFSGEFSFLELVFVYCFFFSSFLFGDSCFSSTSCYERRGQKFNTFHPFLWDFSWILKIVTKQKLMRKEKIIFLNHARLSTQKIGLQTKVSKT